MRAFFTVFVLFLGALNSDLFACSCGSELLANRLAYSEFVATVNVLSAEPDTINEGYHNLQIEVIELFKGQQLSTIKVHSMLKSSCAFLPRVGSKWLVFAGRYNGLLSFGYCSGGKDLGLPRWTKSPQSIARAQRSVDRKLDFLRFVTENKILVENTYDLGISLPKDFKEKTSGYKGSERGFAIYQFEVRKNLSVRKIKILKEFDNQKLSSVVNKYVKKAKKAYKWKRESIPEKVVVTIGLYFYAAEKKYKSFVSGYDL